MLLPKKKIQSQKGQVLVLSVILMPLFLIMTILVIEVGFFYVKQTQLQHAADAIALAGINSTDEAEKIVALNRTVDFTNVTIPDGYPTTEENSVSTVVLQENIFPIFVKIFGTGKITTIEAYSKAKDNKLVPWNWSP